jgi:lipopolysaccharide biosynthesis glycosyltransferase
MTTIHQRPPSPIVFALDENYVDSLSACLASLAQTYDAAEVLEVVVVSQGLSERAVSNLVAIASTNRALSLRQLKLDMQLPLTRGWVTPLTYARVLMGELLPEYSQALYVDVDTIFLDSPEELLRLQLDSRSFLAAVRDVQNPFIGGGRALPNWQDLGLEGSQEYFNAGVMVANLDVWREQDLGRRVLDFVNRKNSHIRFWDQDALNVLTADRWQRLPLKWNCPPLSALLQIPGYRYYANHVLAREEVFHAEKGAAILHFMGPFKPWHARFPLGEASVIFRQNLARANDIADRSSHRESETGK